VWADLARELTAAALIGPGDSGVIPLNSCYVASLPTAPAAEGLAAWLNSSWVRAAARIGAVPAASGFARFSGGTVGGLPLPAAALTDPLLATLGRAGREGKEVQGELDDVAARHLGLCPTARAALLRFVSGRAAHRG
jgi:hypothetical protein